VATDRSGVYYQQLQQFDQKASPQPASENTQVQKVAAPTDSTSVSDSNLVTVTVSSGRPFLYGHAKYGQAEYGWPTLASLTLFPVILEGD